jgi:hypothetical protein
VLVLTDISSLTAGVREPDDGQSLIRFLLFSNEFDVEGMIATSNLGHGQTVRPELIREAVSAYAKVYPSLKRHSSEYPDPAHLLAVVKAGQPVAGPKVPVEASVGDGKDTEGSDWIIRAVDREDSRPLWVLIWGGSADLAQALWKVRATRMPEEQARFLRRLRVHAIGDQDSTGAFIKAEFRGLWYITRNNGIRGMYRGGDTTLVSSEWVEANVIRDHGPLGALYPNYRGGDIWSRTLGQVRGIKEGDTPSFLSLIQNGLNEPERPWLGGWGGRSVPGPDHPAHLIDATDGDSRSDDPDPRMSAVYRWRPDFQAEFAARLDWCVRPVKGGANHPPVVKLKGGRERRLEPGVAVTLDARASRDPDGDRLGYEWSVYPPRTERVSIEPVEKGTARVTAAKGGPVHVLLTVRDSGMPSLARYARVTLNAE